MKKALIWVSAIMLVLCLCGCQVIDSTGGGDEADWPIGVADTSLENILMGVGEFAYYDGFIYFAPPGDIIAEVDLSTMTVAVLDIPCGTWLPNLTTDGEYVYFDAEGGGGGRYRISTDGKTLERVKGYLDQAGTYRYTVGNDSYYIKEGKGGSLCHENMETHEVTQLFDRVSAYYIDETYIYAVAFKEEPSGSAGGSYLFRSNLENIEFEEIKMVTSDTGVEFCPVMVVISDGIMYMDQQGGFSIYTLDLSQVDSLDKTYTVEPLPMASLTYQVIGDKLIYTDDRCVFDENGQLLEKLGDDGLYIYDLKTGETSEMIFPEVYAFCVLADRYIGAHFGDSMGIYDMEKGEYLNLTDAVETQESDTSDATDNGST